MVGFLHSTMKLQSGCTCVRHAQFWLSSCDQVCIKSSEYCTSGFAKKSTAYSPSNRLSMQQALLRRRLKCITNSSSHKECLLKRRRYKRQQTEGQAKEFTVRKARKLLKNAIATVSVTHVWSTSSRRIFSNLQPRSSLYLPCMLVLSNVVSLPLVWNTAVCSVKSNTRHEFRLPSQCKWSLRSFGVLCSIEL